MYTLDSSFVISFAGAKDTRADLAAYRFLRRLSNRTGLFFRQNFPHKDIIEAKGLLIETGKKAALTPGEDESYELSVSSAGVVLKAPSDLGIMHGLETLLQLVTADENGYSFPCAVIKDKPRFPWRGLMIDVSRHFFSVGTIKRNLDAMAAAKLNVFHWHLSDDQGVRVESKKFPQIARLCTDGLYYRQEEIKDIIEYADARGIRVYPEFDIPGHSTAWFTAFPELASAPGPYTIETRWGVFDPTFDPTKEETYKFFDEFIGEMTSLFPDKYFHIGGDENNGKQWDSSASIQAFMKANGIKSNHDLQTYFNKRLLTILTKYNKQMIGWDEILQPGMPSNIMIQSWRGTKSLAEAAKKGFSGILSNGYYIDLMQPASQHYLNDPVPETLGLTETESASILGGEATMWAELITEETIDSRIWPRTAAIAERFWSPREVQNVDDMYRRLDLFSFQLEAVGSLHLKNRDMMIARLTGKRKNDGIKTFLGLLEPVKKYDRHRQGRKYTSYSPYSRTVDIATADAKIGRAFTTLCRGYINQPEEFQEALIETLTELISFCKKFKDEIKPVPSLHEMRPHADNLQALCEFMLPVVQKEKKTALTKEQETELKELIRKNGIPAGQTELMTTEGFNLLFSYLTIK